MTEHRLFGVRLHSTSREEASELVLTPAAAPRIVVTPNAVILERCRTSPELRALVNHADLSLPDGMGAVMAARHAGLPIRERVAGIEFGEALLSKAAARGLRVYLLGGKPGVAARAGERLAARHAGLCIVGTHDGYFPMGGEEERRLLEELCVCSPHILLVCLGFPLQETWMLRHKASLSGLWVMAGLGGSLDVWAGDCRRAPAVLSRVGLEWAWRMGLQPRRMRDLPILLRFLRHATEDAAETKRQNPEKPN